MHLDDEFEDDSELPEAGEDHAECGLQLDPLGLDTEIDYFLNPTSDNKSLYTIVTQNRNGKLTAKQSRWGLDDNKYIDIRAVFISEANGEKIRKHLSKYEPGTEAYETKLQEDFEIALKNVHNGPKGSIFFYKIDKKERKISKRHWVSDVVRITEQEHYDIAGSPTKPGTTSLNDYLEELKKADEPLSTIILKQDDMVKDNKLDIPTAEQLPPAEGTGLARPPKGKPKKRKPKEK